jgi:hypothetical protein
MLKASGRESDATRGHDGRLGKSVVHVHVPHGRHNCHDLELTRPATLEDSVVWLAKSREQGSKRARIRIQESKRARAQDQENKTQEERERSVYSTRASEQDREQEDKRSKRASAREQANERASESEQDRYQ